MQKYKKEFLDNSIKGTEDKDATYANIQSCIRMNDFAEVGDATHLLNFNMIGLFSFRDLSVNLAIQFFMNFLGKKLGIAPDYVTVHPDVLNEYKHHWRHYNVKIKTDKDCIWTDGEISGYCTEFYKNGVEIGNIVNPLGTCIDVGFGLERLENIVNGTKAPDTKTSLRNAITAILDSGYFPGPKQQGYVLRKLIRALYRLGDDWDNVHFQNEIKRQERLKIQYNKLKDTYPDASAEWWYDTHGIVLEDMQ